MNPNNKFEKVKIEIGLKIAFFIDSIFKLVVSIAYTLTQIKMGNTHNKRSSNNGEIVNNVTVQDIVKIDNPQIFFLLCAILAVLLANLFYKLYMNHRRGLRKRYLQSPARVALVDTNTV